MNEKDAVILKVLSELDLRENPEIPIEMKNVHPDKADEKYLDDIINLFNNISEK